jgi:starch synthase
MLFSTAGADPFVKIGGSREYAFYSVAALLLPWWAQDMHLPLVLLSVDHIVAASPTYAREKRTPKYGSGLHEFLKTRARSNSGILNGINPDQWDPLLNPTLRNNYTPDSPDYRLTNKETLQIDLARKSTQAAPG